MDVTVTCLLCRHVVLDEADQMLERGFADSVEEILAASFSSFKGDCLQSVDLKTMNISVPYL